MITNGSGWNNHRTASALNNMLADSAEHLPTVPNGYAVLVAPISDKPFGLRCALVKVLPRFTEVIDGVEYDDGADGEEYGWAVDSFHLGCEKIYSIMTEQQDEDSSAYFIKVMAEQIAKLA